MSFTQMLTVRTDDPDRLRELIEGWHEDQHGVAPGYEGARIMADRQRPGHMVIEVNFSSEEAAEANNDRPETQRWASDVRELVDGEPEYHDYDVVYTTA